MKVYVSLLLLAIGAGLIRAQSSALLNYPIADVLGHREVQIYHIVTSAQPKLKTQYANSTNWILGLYDNFEISGLHDWSGSFQAGLKINPWRSADGNSSFGFGWQDVRGAGESPFAAFRQTFGNWNAYVGWQRDTESRGLFGLDFMFSDQWSCGVEYASAASGGLSLGVYYYFTPDLSLQGIWTRQNDRTSDDVHQWMLSYTFRV